MGGSWIPYFAPMLHANNFLRTKISGDKSRLVIHSGTLRLLTKIVGGFDLDLIIKPTP